MNPQQITESKDLVTSELQPGSPRWPAEFSDRLIPLCDGRSGLRAALQIQAQSAPAGQETAGTGGTAVIDFISSNATIDRYDEVIRAEGWRLENYRRNPVFQNAHQYGDIIFTLGKALLTEIRTAPRPHLFQRIEFAVDVNPMARVAYGLYKNKFLNAVSVGFIPLRWQNEDGTQHTAREISPDSNIASRSAIPELTPASVKQPRGTAALATAPLQRQARRIYLEQELLEVSAVGIPANPEALQLGLKAGVLQMTDLKELLELLTKSTEAKPLNAENPATIPGFASTTNQPASGPSSILHPPSSSFPKAATNTPAGAPGVRGDGAQLLQLARVLREVLRRS